MLKIQKASAGSGKTFTLAREYIKLLIGYRDEKGTERLREDRFYRTHKPQSAILAVTFTNKATGEMMERIVKELYSLSLQQRREEEIALSGRSGIKESAHLAFFRECFRTPTAGVARASRLALENLLYFFSWFNVSTIDSFFQNIVRTFARDLELPDNYTLEIDQTYPVAVAVGQMLSLVDSPAAKSDPRIKFLAGQLEEFMGSRMESGGGSLLMSRSSELTRSLMMTIGDLLQEGYKLHRREIDSYLEDVDKMEEFYKAITVRIKQLGTRMKNAAADLVVFDDDEHGFELSDAVNRYLVALAKNMAEEKPYKYPLNDTQTHIIAGEIQYLKADYLPKMVKGVEKPAKKNISPDLAAAVSGFIAAAKECVTQMHFLKKIRSNFYTLVLFGYAHRELEKYIKDNDAFLLGNTNELISILIGDEKDAPFIYERTGTRIEHFLIDEFQDTSEMQWNNFKPLIDESMANGNDNLIIGDVKQSIYRFRNSRPELLQTVVEKQFGDENVEVRGLKLKENTNYRSAPEIVKFNNTVFKYIAGLVNGFSAIDDDSITEAYSGLVQQLPPKPKYGKGYVKMLLNLREKGSKTQAFDDDAETETPDEVTLAELAAEIKRELSEGVPPGDIAVLTRTNGQGTAVIKYMLDNMKKGEWPRGNVRFMSNDAMILGENESVKAVINVLRLINTPEQTIDLREHRNGNEKLIDNPTFRRQRLASLFQMCCRGEDADPDKALKKALKLNAPAGEETPEDLKEDAEVLENALQSIRENKCPNLFEIVESIIRLTLSPQETARDNAFITALQDAVVDYMESGRSDVASFLGWWDRKGCSSTLPAPEGLDAINVSTIHKSKGLDYLCVHVPFLPKELVSSSVFQADYAWYRLDKKEFGFVPDQSAVPEYIPMRVGTLKNFDRYKRKEERSNIEKRLDLLNLMYVAFTRAERELLVYGNYVAGSDDSTGTNPAFARLLTDAASGVTEQWIMNPTNVPDGERPFVTALAPYSKDENNLTVFEYGEPVNLTEMQADKADEKDASGCMLRSEPLGFYNTAERSEITVSDDMDDIPRLNFDSDRSRGIFLHAVMEKIRTAGDLKKALHRAAYQADLPAEKEREYGEILEKALRNPVAAPWFAPGNIVDTEIPATAKPPVKSGKKVKYILKRPDRIVWAPDGSVSVIDYKFGRHADDEQFFTDKEGKKRTKKSGYESQVRGYMNLLRAQGEKNVKGYLWYVLENRIEEVPLVPPRK